MDPVHGKPADPPQKPSAVAKFCGRAVSVLGRGARAVGRGLITPVKWMKALGSYDTSVQLSRNAVLGIFKHRNASTDEAKQKKSLAVIDAMEEIGKDYADVQRLSSRKQGLFVNMIKSSMGLSKESGCGPDARIANIHYWVIACERDINPKHLSPEAQAGLQIMQHFIREAADEFHQKNLAILGNAMTEYNEGEAPTIRDAAAVLLDCLSTEERHHHRAAKVGYDFGALKGADRTQEIGDTGFLDSSILRNHYMAPVSHGGLGLTDLDAAKEQHYNDWENYEGPYSPDFWDGSPGRSLGDLMRHVDVEMLKETIENFDSNSSKIYDLRFPIVTPKEPHRVSPFVDPIVDEEYDSDDDFYIYRDPIRDIYDDVEYSDEEDDYDYYNPPKVASYGVDEHISVEDDEDDSINKKEVISPRSLPWEEEVEEEDRIISELVDAPEFEKEVIQLDERELDVLEDDFVPENQGSIAEQYHLPPGSQIGALTEPAGKRGQGVLVQSDQLELDPTHSEKIDVKTDNQRRAAPQRNRADIIEPDQPDFSSASGNIDVASDNKVTIRFFDDGMIALLESMGIRTKDLELLDKHGQIQALRDVFKANPDMVEADKIDLIQAKLAEVKGALSAEEHLAHYHGMAPSGNALDVGMLATQSLFSNLFGGDAGKTVAGVLQDMALQLRQERLDLDKQAFLERLLEKKGKTLEDFKSFEPENIFDAYRVEGLFNEADLPALLALTTGREIVILDQGNINPVNGDYTATTYAVNDGELSARDHFSSYDRLGTEKNVDRIVFLKNEDGAFQVLRPISDED